MRENNKLDIKIDGGNMSDGYGGYSGTYGGKAGRGKKEKRHHKWLNWGYVFLAVGTSCLIWLCSVILYG